MFYILLVLLLICITTFIFLLQYYLFYGIILYYIGIPLFFITISFIIYVYRINRKVLLLNILGYMLFIIIYYFIYTHISLFQPKNNIFTNITLFSAHQTDFKPHGPLDNSLNTKLLDINDLLSKGGIKNLFVVQSQLIQFEKILTTQSGSTEKLLIKYDREVFLKGLFSDLYYARNIESWNNNILINKKQFDEYKKLYYSYFYEQMLFDKISKTQILNYNRPFYQLLLSREYYYQSHLGYPEEFSYLEGLLLDIESRVNHINSSLSIESY